MQQSTQKAYTAVTLDGAGVFIFRIFTLWLVSLVFQCVWCVTSI